jgi:hypothetical protein
MFMQALIGLSLRGLYRDVGSPESQESFDPVDKQVYRAIKRFIRRFRD